ncbi:MAG TPA: acyl-CoA dehydrogenase family protein [Solirubrobacteraceae bacterium]|nr:acyl-CoA dehydrogenase family protein [Solirubrobacteraceae bacterium]
MAVIDKPQAIEIYEREHEIFRRQFQKFLAKEVTPNIAQWDRDEIIDRSLFNKLGEAGFLAMAVPEEFGGAGTSDFRYNAVIGYEAGLAGAFTPLLGPSLHTDIVLPYLLEYCTEEQKQRWLPGVTSGEKIMAIGMTEPGTGSDLANIQTEAVREGDHYILNGAKTYITNGINADIVVVACKTKPEGGHRGLSLLVLERGMDGFTRGRNLQKLGQHAQDTAELFFKNVKVPVENLLGEENKGFSYLVHNLAQERLSVAVAVQGTIDGAIRDTLAFVKERKAFGRPVGTFQNSRFVMAKAKTAADVSRAFVDNCVMKLSRNELTPEEAAMVKYWTTDLQGKVTDELLQLWGGNGYMAETSIARAWSDARVTRIYAGTNEIMLEIIGRGMGLGEPR